MMRRTPLRAKPKPRAPRPDRSAEFASWTPSMRKVGVYAPAGELRAAPKDPEPVRDEDYRRLVAALPCAICGVIGASQAAHSNAGKGLAVKTCDLTCFPLCHDGANGHHRAWDEYRFGRDVQRDYERRYAAITRDDLRLIAQTDPNARRVLERIGILTPEGVET